MRPASRPASAARSRPSASKSTSKSARSHWLSELAAHAVIAARLAVADAGIAEVAAPDRAGVVFGTGFGSLAESGPHYVKWAEIGDAAARPATIPTLMLNAPRRRSPSTLAFAGPASRWRRRVARGATLSVTQCARSRRGGKTSCWRAAAERALTELMLLSWGRLRVLSRRNDEPERASRPFDARRDGLVLADAVVLLVLESEDHLARRGGRALAELVGFGSNCGAGHLTAPDQASEASAMRSASKSAVWIEKTSISSSPMGPRRGATDVVEGQALREVFGDNGSFPALAALKSMVGHSMGASGRSAPPAAAFALESGTIPPTINLDAPDPQCQISGFAPVATRRTLRHAVVNAFAFGGHNAVLVLRRV